MKTGPANDKYRIMAEINMIPLIDVALVLLIIFMVVTPILVKSQIKINLPTAGKASKATEAETLKVQVTREGTVYLEGRETAEKALAEEIARVVGRDHPEEHPLLIEADKDVPFEHVIKVMDAARNVGLVKIVVGVRPLPKAGDERRRP